MSVYPGAQRVTANPDRTRKMGDNVRIGHDPCTIQHAQLKFLKPGRFKITNPLGTAVSGLQAVLDERIVLARLLC
jgi:hypothetical protein